MSSDLRALIPSPCGSGVRPGTSGRVSRRLLLLCLSVGILVILTSPSAVELGPPFDYEYHGAVRDSTLWASAQTHVSTDQASGTMHLKAGTAAKYVGWASANTQANLQRMWTCSQSGTYDISFRYVLNGKVEDGGHDRLGKAFGVHLVRLTSGVFRSGGAVFASSTWAYSEAPTFGEYWSQTALTVIGEGAEAFGAPGAAVSEVLDALMYLAELTTKPKVWNDSVVTMTVPNVFLERGHQYGFDAQAEVNTGCGIISYGRVATVDNLGVQVEGITVTFHEPAPVQGNDLTLGSLAWDDPDGDRDCVAEAGERVRMKPQLCSSVNVQNVRAVLYSGEGSIRITDSTVNFDPMLGNCEWATDWCDIDLTSSLASRTVYFVMRVFYERDGNPCYQDLFPWHTFPEAVRPKFQVIGQQVYDPVSITQSNNGDAVFQSSEDVRVQFQIKNVGTAGATNVRAYAVYNAVYNGPPVVDIPRESYIRYGNLGAGASAWPNAVDSLRVTSLISGFAGPVTFDVVYVWGDVDFRDTVASALRLSIEPAPVISVRPEGLPGNDFGRVPPGTDVRAVVRVSNGGSASLTVTDVAGSHGDMVIDPAHKAFTLVPGDYHDVPITIHTNAIPDGTRIDREVIVTSNGRIPRPGDDRAKIAGLVTTIPQDYWVPLGVRQEQPDVDDSLVVWVDYRNGNPDVYARNLLTGKEFPVTANPAGQRKPRLRGHIVAWEDSRNSIGADGNSDIYGFDLSTGAEFPVSTDGKEDLLLGMDGRRIAFIRQAFTYNYGGGQVPGYNLYYYDIATHETHQMTQYTAPSAGSDIHSVTGQGDAADGVIVWEDMVLKWVPTTTKWADEAECWTAKFKPGTDSGPVLISQSSCGPVTSGGRIAYMATGSPSRCQVWLWDGASHQVTTEDTDHRGDNRFALGGDILVYLKSSSNDLLWWDLSTGKERILSQRGWGNVRNVRTDGITVVWDYNDVASALRRVCVAFPKGATPPDSMWKVDVSRQPTPFCTRLGPVYPNPFNSSTTVHYELAGSQMVWLAVHNVLGQRVRTLVNDSEPAGAHNIAWDGNDAFGRAAGSGVYLVRLVTPETTLTRRVTLLR